MLEKFSAEYIKKAEARSRFTPLYFRRKLSRFINKWRELVRSVMSFWKYHSYATPGITENLEKAAGHFQKHGWVLVENIISKDFHEELIKNWPSRYAFFSPNLLAKSYDSGFYWVNDEKADLRQEQFDPYNQYPAISKFLNYLRSDEFEKRITSFVGLGKDFGCYSFTVNRSYAGTEVIPHKDGVQDDPSVPAIINMVFFINGTGGKNSGGLSLSKDSEMKQMIVEPENLKNACLIYDSKADFYHGFSPVARDKFRWAINSQFCVKSSIKKS